MNNQNLIVYQLNPLYKIFKELEEDLNFRVIETLDEKSLINITKNLDNYLVIAKKEISNINNQYTFNHLPIKIFKMIEKLNVEFLKLQFNEQSQVIISNYTIDINSRKMFSNNVSLKLTEKEVNTIIYLSKVNKPITINELQTKVWDYNSDLETHTVETHIYRLRKKIIDKFKDSNFISSTKKGYKIL